MGSPRRLESRGDNARRHCVHSKVLRGSRGYHIPSGEDGNGINVRERGVVPAVHVAEQRPGMQPLHGERSAIGAVANPRGSSGTTT